MVTESVPKRKFRPEIEGLRTVAFLLVAVFHIWLNRVSGGVDVFFTVAGFLVTTSLLGHFRRFGRVRVRVYAERLGRRLLPPVIVVISACIVLSMIVLPVAKWRDAFAQAFASVTYWENWYLAVNAVDYLAVNTSRSPFQHFWALSAQGQFYVIWAVAFIAVGFIARRLELSVKRVAIGFLSVMVIVSLVYSVIDTQAEQSFAYFNTFARVWEFGLGGLLALILDKIHIHSVLGAISSWIAFAAFVLTGVLLPVADLFPGYIALIPVLAACVLIATGGQTGGWGADKLLASKPLVYIGGLGYGVYLWHWPMLIFALAIQGRGRAGFETGLVVIVSALVAAWVTKKIIEQPFATWAGSQVAKVRRGSLALILASAVVVAGVGVAGYGVQDQALAQEQQRIAQLKDSGCFGAAALVSDVDCGSGDQALNEYLPTDPTRDAAEVFKQECTTSERSTEFKPCTWGASGGESRVALIGNSHGAVWFPAWRDIAEKYGWRLDTYVKTKCTFNQATRVVSGGRTLESCDAWTDTLAKHLEKQEPYDYILYSAAAWNSKFIDPSSGEHTIQAGIEGYKQVWRPIVNRGTKIFVIRDYPQTTHNLIECAISNPDEGCGRPQRQALVDPEKETLIRAAKVTEGVIPIDMTAWFCQDGICPNVIGNVHVYTNPGHFTNTYGETLAEPLLGEIRARFDFPENDAD